MHRMTKSIGALGLVAASSLLFIAEAGATVGRAGPLTLSKAYIRGSGGAPKGRHIVHLVGSLGPRGGRDPQTGGGHPAYYQRTLDEQIVLPTYHPFIDKRPWGSQGVLVGLISELGPTALAIGVGSKGYEVEATAIPVTRPDQSLRSRTILTVADFVQLKARVGSRKHDVHALLEQVSGLAGIHSLEVKNTEFAGISRNFWNERQIQVDVAVFDPKGVKRRNLQTLKFWATLVGDIGEPAELQFSDWTLGSAPNDV